MKEQNNSLYYLCSLQCKETRPRVILTLSDHLQNLHMFCDGQRLLLICHQSTHPPEAKCELQHKKGKGNAKKQNKKGKKIAKKNTRKGNKRKRDGRHCDRSRCELREAESHLSSFEADHFLQKFTPSKKYFANIMKYQNWFFKTDISAEGTI